MSNQSANDLIMGAGGPPAAKFPTVGTIVRGEIVDTAVTQQRDFATGELKVVEERRQPDDASRRHHPNRPA